MDSLAMSGVVGSVFHEGFPPTLPQEPRCLLTDHLMSGEDIGGGGGLEQIEAPVVSKALMAPDGGGGGRCGDGCGDPGGV
ncbi:hypothetical protein Tco_0851712 [Tanacetum coccineum]